MGDPGNASSPLSSPRSWRGSFFLPVVWVGVQGEDMDLRKESSQGIEVRGSFAGEDTRRVVEEDDGTPTPGGVWHGIQEFQDLAAVDEPNRRWLLHLAS